MDFVQSYLLVSLICLRRLSLKSFFLKIQEILIAVMESFDKGR